MPPSKPVQAILNAVYEYLLITIPVALYVSLEATHAHDAAFLWRTPEWSMATVFLLFQGIALYNRSLSRSGAKVSGASIGLLSLLSLLIGALTLINAYTSLKEEDNTIGAISFRLGLLLITSCGFVALVSAAKLYQIKKDRNNHV